MAHKTITLATCLAPLALSAFEAKPWFDELLEFRLDSAYTYSVYSHVQGAHPPLQHTSNDQLLRFDLAVSPLEFLQAQAEIEFADTPRFAWGMRSTGAQLRRQFFDDITGDPFSLTSGLSVRYVPTRALSDVSTPYHAPWDFALTTSIGKEWSNGGPYFSFRTFGQIVIGMGNRGSPWLDFLAFFQTNHNDAHRLNVIAASSIGLGGQRTIDIDHFGGYARIQHRNIDLGVGYHYHFNVWGELGIDYTYRVYAHLFPERVNFLTASYSLPFSFF